MEAAGSQPTILQGDERSEVEITATMLRYVFVCILVLGF